MQSSGTLSELSLEGILETVQKDRATGTLSIRAPQGQATLYFLFGHLFHAVDGGDQQGESVVHSALEWSDGDFTFDSKAKLPAEETIKVSTAELLASRPAGGAAEVAPETTEAQPDEAPGANGAEPPAAEAEPTVEAEAEAPEAVAEPEPEPEPEPVAAPAAAETPRRRGTDKRPGTRPPETMTLYPVPLGKTIHEGLTAGFVDFPKLLRSLSKDKHSGYVRLSGEGFIGVLLFSSGAVVEAIYDAESQVRTGTSAFHTFGDRIDAGEGSLDVIQLSPEMVTGIYQLLSAPSLYDRLLARFIKADALLEYLGEQGTSGSVIVRHGGSVGIVLYRAGQMLGSYTDASREVSETAEKVIALCDEPGAEIEVRGGELPDTLPVMEPETQGAPREVPSGSRASRPATAEPVAEPEPAAEAPAAETAPETEATESSDAPAAAEGGTDGRDWSAAINEMAGRADAVLGTRSKKVKELLYSANHRRADIDSTIDKIAELSIMFVDPSKLSSLADEFRGIAARND